MLEARGEPGFAQEPLAEALVSGQLGGQDLDGDASVERDVSAE